MMQRLITVSALCLLTINAGCASKSGSGADSAPPAAQSIPADSPLAKVQVGMTAQEVSNILGMPTNQVSYASGKAFIPFYYGDDARRTEWSYKGMGRVVFSGGNIFGGGGGRVNRIDYDPNETGVRVQ